MKTLRDYWEHGWEIGRLVVEMIRELPLLLDEAIVARLDRIQASRAEPTQEEKLLALATDVATWHRITLEEAQAIVAKAPNRAGIAEALYRLKRQQTRMRFGGVELPDVR